MRSALLALLLTPAAALAQSITVSTLSSTESSGNPPEIFVGADNCATQVLHFNWTLSGDPTGTGQTVNIVKARSASTCSSTTVTSPDTTEQAPSQGISGSDDPNASALILDQTDAGMPGGCSNTTVSSAAPYNTFYCVQITGSSLLGGTSTSAASIEVSFATAPPTPPAAVSAAGGDQHLRINWTAGNSAENIKTYDIHVLADGDTLDTSKHAAEVTAQTNTDVTTTDQGQALQNNVDYTVQVTATDVYGNVSELSDAVTGTPVAVLDFYNLYRHDGGGARGHGGCSSSGATWIVLLGLVAGLWARRKRAGAALLVLLALLLPAAARAQEDRPARHVLVGFKVDRYDPKIDSESGLSNDRPYYQIFGPRAPLRYQLEVDWEVAHPFGSLLIGATAGFWQNYGKGIVSNPDGTPKVDGSGNYVKSSDTALLDIVPLGLIATYRFDWLADRWPRFPFIPYAQIGLMRALWASFSGTGSVSQDKATGAHGSGWTFGYTTALGFAFSLDAIDPELTREAYMDTGIQRTAFFAEYGWTRLDNFAGSNALILTDRAWRFGLSVEF